MLQVVSLAEFVSERRELAQERITELERQFNEHVEKRANELFQERAAELERQFDERVEERAEKLCTEKVVSYPVKFTQVQVRGYRDAFLQHY